MRRKFALMMMIATFLVCTAFNAPVALQQAGVNWVVNGGMQDSDLDNVPDGWTLIGSPFTDGVRCFGFTRRDCWYEFNGVIDKANGAYPNHGLRQFVTPDLTGITAVTFSFRAQGFLTDAGAAGAAYVYTGGVFPIQSHFIQLPINVAFNQVYTVTFPLPINTTGFHIDAAAARAGSWSITDVRLEAAAIRRQSQ